MKRYILPTLAALCLSIPVPAAAQEPSPEGRPAQQKSEQARLKVRFAEEMRLLQATQKAEIKRLQARHLGQKKALRAKYKGIDLSPETGPGSEQEGRLGRKPPRMGKDPRQDRPYVGPPGQLRPRRPGYSPEARPGGGYWPERQPKAEREKPGKPPKPKRQKEAKPAKPGPAGPRI